MLQTPSPRSRGGGGTTLARRLPTTPNTGVKGHFANGIWRCNCNPPLPAEHFQVKKDGRNKGRWFYTCQHTAAARCGFFLWGDDARLREEGAVLGNSRTEPWGGRDGVVQESWRPGKRRLFEDVGEVAVKLGREDTEEASTSGSSPSPLLSPIPPLGGRRHTALKRSARDALFDEDEDGDTAFPWALTAQEEWELAAVADTSAVVPVPHTPREAPKTGVYATPTTTTGKRKLPWLEQQRQHPHPTTTSPNLSAVSTITEETLHNQQASTSETSPSLHQQDHHQPLTSQILPLLHAAPPQILIPLRDVLTTHDRRTQGLARGREAARRALKDREAHIVELRARVEVLEAERELAKRVIADLRSGGGKYGCL